MHLWALWRGRVCKHKYTLYGTIHNHISLVLIKATSLVIVTISSRVQRELMNNK